jgi:hypothetical protein
MGVGAPLTPCWPSHVLWMPPSISRAFLSRPRASLASLYNPNTTVHSLLYLLCSITDAIVFTCRSEIHHHHLALALIGLMVEFA